MSLSDYRAKRDFSITPEPKGRMKPPRKTGLVFLVQKHATRRLHYDLRLEFGGVFKSWAITRGPSLDPEDRRLAVETEDHPLDYDGFEGIIPKGAYGAGTMIVWDRGVWHPVGDAAAGFANGHLEFTLNGERLSGNWHLIRMKAKEDEKRVNWLLVKAEDGAARSGSGDLLERHAASVVSGRTIEDVTAGAPARRPVKRAPGKRSGLPNFLPPMLAVTMASPPSGPMWMHEVKFDGYRLQARIESGKLRLLTRSGLDWTKRFAGPMQMALASLPVRQALIDGEVVAEAADGTGSFSILQADLAAGRGDRLVYWAFDLLHLDGRDLTALPLDDRKAALAGLIGDRGPVRLSEGFDGDGPTILAHACRIGAEGIVSKNRTAPYRSERSKSWVKSKCIGRAEFVIGGFTESRAGTDRIGALVLGAHDQGGALVPVGRVGTGFSEALARSLHAQLTKLKQETSPFSPGLAREAARGVHYVRPELVGEVEYRAVTADGNLRHASFRGLRDDKPASNVMLDLVPHAPTPIVTVKLTHPDRVYWPEANITKRDLADYYTAIWPWIAPHVTGRPLALLRAPEGIHAETFFQKNHHPGEHPALDDIRNPRRSSAGALIGIHDLDGLITLAQLGALEIHPWGAPIDALERPDRLILDLDPGEGVEWADILSAAALLRDTCEAAGLVPFAKTSGGKGIHIVCPLDGQAGWDQVKGWTRALANAVASSEPTRFVAKPGPARRKGRIFVDYLRNGYGATAVAAYSPRARPAAGVSTPLTWDELARLTSPTQFTLGNVRERLERINHDPWDGFTQSARPLPG